MPKRLTTEQFIIRAINVHGNKYNYSRVKYVNKKTKVEIWCNTCESFAFQRPDDHLKTGGCKACGILHAAALRRSNTSEFINKAKKVHKGLYGYDKVNYIGTDTKVEIFCLTHNKSFFQRPHSHLRGDGCPDCGALKTMSFQRSNTKEFINKAINIHGVKYDYSSVDYINSKTKVEIVCKNDDHKPFKQTPGDHLAGYGCPSCGIESSSRKATSTTSEFILKANIVHKNHYDYSLTEYVSSSQKVDIICPEHGVWSTLPNTHISRGCGCPRCSGNRGMNTEDFILRANKVHNNLYDYSMVDYKFATRKVKIMCRVKGHGIFEQQAVNHLKGCGCPKCARENNSISKRVHGTEPATLYYIKLTRGNKVYYKIGVTKHNVSKRFEDEARKGLQVEALMTHYFEKGGDAYTWEDVILKVFREFKTKDAPLYAKGNTEVFDNDVLHLDH